MAADLVDPEHRTRSIAAMFGRLTTGAKLFLILGGALLLPALISVMATLQTSRLVDSEVRARLRIAADESARALAIELGGDMRALRVAVDAIGADPTDPASCARAQGAFAQQSSIGARFRIVGIDGQFVCGDTGLPMSGVSVAGAQPVATIVPGRGLALTIAAPRRRIIAEAYFPQPFLKTLGRPTSRVTAFSSALTHGDQDLPLEMIPDASRFDRLETMRADLGIAGLGLRTSVPSAPITSSFVVSLLIPVLMWAAAAGIAWIVVDRLLIRPLRQLRASVAAYEPGEVIDTSFGSTWPAQEIRELGDTFRAISRTVALHEAGLAQGLIRQTKLTREVHHRVKNNLQVIASLINFHARGARSPDAAMAYASIQRRVDALAVVHRHHFAELEDNTGLNIRTMVGELASNIRASAPEGSRLGISLDVDPLLVSQDIAVAVSFLITETLELAMTCDPAAQIRVAIKPVDDAGKGRLRVVSRSLVDTDALRELALSRYGRVMEGLSRQLRSKLHHDPLTGAYEIDFAILGHS